MESGRVSLAKGETLGRLSFQDRDEKVRVKENGVEIGSKYFLREFNEAPPRSAYWRNNLTALSQHRNLYFVAFGHQIYVYQPPSRDRVLAPKPKMIITPIAKNPTAPGYITRHNPHIINVIRVEDLGHEEILLLATDSGNIAAYRTERIFAVIEEARVTGNDQPTELGELVDCFFSDWVGQSAWGLAIHKTARMIAVSSNSWCITVFAFALVDDASVASDAAKSLGTPQSSPTARQSLEWTNVSSESQYNILRRIKPEKRRAYNIRFTLVGHKKNIPNIDFLNSDLDPDGDWLISTDIGNKLMMFNIWEYPTPVRVIDIQQDPPNHPGRSHENRQLGWSVLALDPHVYDLTALAQSMRSNYLPEEPLHPDDVADESDDLSDETFSLGSDIPASLDSPMAADETVLNHFSPCCPMYPGEGKEYGNNQKPFGNLESEQNICLDRGNEDENDAQLHNLLQESISDSMEDTPWNSDLNRLPGSWPSLHGDPTGLVTDPELADDLILSVIDTTEDIPSNTNDSDIQEDDGDDGDEYLDHADEEDEEEVEEEEEEEHEDTQSDEEVYNYEYAAFQYGGSNGDSSLFESLQQHNQGGDSIDPLFPDISDWLSDTEDPEPLKPLFADFPILHFTQTSVRMFPHPFAKKSTVILRDALTQDLINIPLDLDMVDRFNIVHQIPELGIVLAASQKGRVGIFSLTEYPDGMAFRLDHVIPSESQERQRARPFVQLAGMAIGPVESHLIPLDESSYSTSSSPLTEDNHTTSARQSHHSYHSRSVGNHTESTQTGEHSSRTYSGRQVPDNGFQVRQEQWHGIEFSRRYRVILMFTNLTLLHYEIFYDWPADMMGPHGQLLQEVGRGSLLRP
ncbi:CRT10 superfamily domain-containing protein [Histoplasma capsulatum]|uniref:CRT10 superfamily domain-containing protein n=1 Tax=Ajellomyces capsulatus TaxID=5037 RepID=A0A8A1MF02_AJECA|nr:CRT10 superfamily domain-containing protein [Histoplasma capsulatum]